jgi:CBS domain-containing protein
MNAKAVMSMNVATVSAEMSVRHVAQIMLDRHVSGLPVIDDEGTLVGIVTEGDLMRRFELGIARLPPGEASTIDQSEENARAYVKSHGWKVGDVMTRHVITVEEETPLSRVAELFEEQGIKRAPVMRQGKLVGIISRADLLRALVMAKVDQTAPGDAAIRRSILARLREDSGFPADLVKATVLDGIAHLWGAVSSKAEGRAACVIAETTRGVKAVEDHLRILAEEGDAAASRGQRR